MHKVNFIMLPYPSVHASTFFSTSQSDPQVDKPMKSHDTTRSHYTIEIETEQQMLSFGQQLGAAMQAQAHQAHIITLQGELGAGKTTLTRGILQHFGHTGKVKSPTYTLVEPYEFSDFTLYHFDLYRLQDPGELLDIGFTDYLQPGNFCVIEWPERASEHLPKADIQCHIQVVPGGREVSIAGQGLWEQELETNIPGFFGLPRRSP